jgi:hypothetical protein
VEKAARGRKRNVIPTFDRFVGVDWSGATGSAYSGVAVAECRAGSGAPALVPPPGRRWRRADFADWVAAQAATDERLLIGIDCAFALPEPTASALLGDSYSAAALWSYIEAICASDGDFYGGGFADHEEHAPLFWRSGPRPADFAEHHRATEQACRAKGLGTPESPLKLVGARQVGKGGLAGMRVLNWLKQRLGEAFAVWPFDPTKTARVVCVELYPRLFMRMAGHGNGKVRTLDALNVCFEALRSSRYVGNVEASSDHETDALVAAAGLRFIAAEGAVWSPNGLDSLGRRAEGWIFGVI